MVVLGRLALCLKTFEIELLSLLHSCSVRTVSLSRYSIRGNRTWLMMYRHCLSVMCFHSRIFVVALILFLISSFWKFFFPDSQIQVPSILVGSFEELGKIC